MDGKIGDKQHVASLQIFTPGLWIFWHKLLIKNYHTMKKKWTSHYHEKKSALGYLHSSEPAEKNHDDLSGVTESVL